MPFGVDISKLKNVKSIWMDDATYKDVSGSEHLHNQKQIK